MARKSRKDTVILGNTALQFHEKQPTQKVYFVGAYIRLSAEDRKQKGDSIENQQAIINAYIDEQNQIGGFNTEVRSSVPSILELTEIYIDNGKSGQTLERPAFQRMIADMENGKITCCITKDLSRLGRNAIDTGFYIEKFFPTKGIRYISINDNYDSNDSNSGGIMLSLKNMVNEAYALEIGRKISATAQMNIRNGCFVGKIAPYGYFKSKENKHKLEIDPYASEIVKKMFEMVADGYSVTNIADWLESSNILPPKRYLASIGLLTQKETGKTAHWSKSVIYGVLKNRIYTGDMVQGKGRTKSYNVKLIPKEQWVITENTHEPIVSRELFDKVQLLKATVNTRRGKTIEALRIENPFVRKVFCGHCGSSMYREKVKPYVSRKNEKVRADDTAIKYRFACGTRNRLVQSACVPNRIDENVLKTVLLETIQKHAAVFAENADIISVFNNRIDATNNITLIELNKLQSEIESKSHFLKGLYESLVSGDIDTNEYRELKDGYETKISMLTEQEQTLRQKIRGNAIERVKLKDTKATLKSVSDISDLTADMLDKLLERIAVYNDKRIEIVFKFTDETGVNAATAIINTVPNGGADNE